MNEPAQWAILAALCFLPPLAFMVWVRSRERYGREPLSAVLGIFLYGATLGVAVALIFTGALGLGDLLSTLAVAAILVAPIIEEAAKGLGFGFIRRHIDESEDGLVYGAAAGLGFAATETFLYGTTAFLDDGANAAISLILARTMSSMLLHASSSALLGFGYAVHRLRGARGPHLALAYLAAVVLHAAYNFIVLTDTWLAFVGAVVMVVIVWGALMRQLRRLDARPLL